MSIELTESKQFIARCTSISDGILLYTTRCKTCFEGHVHVRLSIVSQQEKNGIHQTQKPLCLCSFKISVGCIYFCQFAQEIFSAIQIKLLCSEGRRQKSFGNMLQSRKCNCGKVGFELRCPDGILQQLWRSHFLRRLPSHEHVVFTHPVL